MTMPIEHGLRLTGQPYLDRKVEAMIRRFDWVYLGPEFCENLLETGICSEVVKFRKMGKKVCLLTPLLTEKGLGTLAAIFKELGNLFRAGRLSAEGLELTINDFGALELAAREKLPFLLNSGRQFTPNCFTTPLGRIAVLNSPALDFFAERGISRYELSTCGARLKTNYGRPGSAYPKARFNLTLYYPYLPFAYTRTCLVGMEDIAPGDSIRAISCSRACRACTFEVIHPGIKEKLLVRGNTVFLEFNRKFYSSRKELERLRVDRLVYCPFP